MSPTQHLVAAAASPLVPGTVALTIFFSSFLITGMVFIFSERCLIFVLFYLPVHEKVLRGNDDFVWQVDSMFHGRFTVDVEFLDLKIASINVN